MKIIFREGNNKQKEKYWRESEAFKTAHKFSQLFLKTKLSLFEIFNIVYDRKLGYKIIRQMTFIFNVVLK